MTRHPSRPRRRPVGLQLRLEVLEDRCLPTIIAQVGTLLTITGTSGPDLIRIGDAGTGQVSVLVGPVGRQTFPQIFNNVTRIVVRTGGGDDTVHYDLLGNVTASRSLDVDLGAGNDRFVAFLNGNDLGAGVNYALNVKGGAGNDRLHVDAGNDPDRATVAQLSEGLVLPFAQAGGNTGGAPGVAIPIGAALRLALDGGSGNDTITVNYQGFIAGSPIPGGRAANEGTLAVLTNGGPGNDVIVTHITTDANSGGRILARELGGPGNDDLTLTVRQQGAPPGLVPTFAVVDALIDGGPGFNRCRRTPNVAAVHCQSDVLLPPLLPTDFPGGVIPPGGLSPRSGPAAPV